MHFVLRHPVVERDRERNFANQAGERAVERTNSLAVTVHFSLDIVDEPSY